MLVSFFTQRWPLTAGGLWGRSPPPICKQKDPHTRRRCHRSYLLWKLWKAQIRAAQNSPAANINDLHGDELTLVFLMQASMTFKSRGVGGGGRSPPMCKQNDPHSFPLMQT